DLTHIAPPSRRVEGGGSMGESDQSYWLFNETSSIWETRDPKLVRNLPLSAGLGWLSAGWRDLWTRPGTSLSYGLGVFLLSVAFVWTLFAFGRDYILFPALAGFMIVAPFLEIGRASCRERGYVRVGGGGLLETRTRA